MANPLAGHTNSYHTYSHDEALQGIAEAGYTAVELSAVPGWTEHVDLDADQGELRRKLEGYGLDPVSLSAHSDLTTAEGLAHGHQGRALGCRVRIPIVNTAVGGHQSADENEAAFLANIGAMADEAEQAGIAIGLEIHGDIMASGAVTLPLLEKIGRDSVGINYDTANVVFYSGDTAGRGPAEGRRQARPRPSEGVQGRQGRLELRRDRHRRRRLRGVLRILRDAGYDGPYSVEIEFTGEPWPPLAEVNAAMRGSREHLDGLGPAMKRYMPEMTNLQVREYLEGGGRTVLVPVGSTEDHGDHGPLWTDVYIPLEVCKRAAEELDALVGPPVPFGLAPDHRGASGIIYVRLATFVSLLRDICVSLAEAGFERIALVNGHYVNTTAMQYAAAEMFDDLPARRAGLSVRVLAGAQAGRRPRRTSRSAGLHANVGETSAVLAIDPEPLRHGARARLRAGARGFHEPSRSRCSTLSSSRRPARSGRSSRRAAACGATRASRRSRRASSSSSGARPPSSASCATWRRCTTGSRRGTTASGSRAHDHDRDPRRRVHGRLARRELPRARRSGARQDDRVAPERPGRRGRGARSAPS